LPFENKLLCPAGTAAFLLFSLGRLRGKAWGMRDGRSEEIKQGLPSENKLLRPAGAGAFL